MKSFVIIYHYQIKIFILEVNMRSILDVGKDIFYEIKSTGNPKLLLDLYNIRTKVWKYHIINDEFGTYGPFNDITELDSILAFELISTAVVIVVNQVDKNLLTTALSLLLTCIVQSNTTEIPNELLKNWTCISNKVSAYNFKDITGYWDEINKWYRIEEL